MTSLTIGQERDRVLVVGSKGLDKTNEMSNLLRAATASIPGLEFRTINFGAELEREMQEWQNPIMIPALAAIGQGLNKVWLGSPTTEMFDSSPAGQVFLAACQVNNVLVARYDIAMTGVGLAVTELKQTLFQNTAW